jgi:TolB-like protein
MPRSLPSTRFRLAAALVLWTAAGGAAAAAEPARVALLPVQDRSGDSAAVRAVEEALARGLAGRHELVGRERLRDALRARRVRSVDDAPPEVLQALGRELGAERFVTAIVHLAEREACPRLAVSARSYDAATGELDWAGFEAGSGLDGRRLLGLGAIGELELLAERIAHRLIDGLAAGLEASELAPAARAGASGGAPVLGAVAVVPLAGLAESDATRAAETATEIVRAVLARRGVPVLSPNRVAESLRRERVLAWGALDVPVRDALAAAGAELLLTGTVEAWEAAGDGFEPEPVVAVALRLLDARSGRILWTGALERRGWDRQGLFRLGRIHDHGTLGERMIDELVETMIERLRSPAP